MFAGKTISRAKRRGIVLVVILGMLGLLALIGVTFATLSGQARINARNYMQAQQQPGAGELFDFALAQLIDDTGLPTSAIRGHSLKRDMYGNDAYNNGYLAQSPSTTNPTPANGGPVMMITGSTTYTGPTGVTYAKLATNIVAPDTSFYGYDFTRWYIRLVPATSILADGTPMGQQLSNPAQSFEVLSYDMTGTDSNFSGRLVFHVALPDSSTYIQVPPPGTPSPPGPGTPYFLTQPPGTTLNASTPIPFILDGRYLRAFNGPGMDALASYLSVPIRGMSRYANFRVNGNVVTNLVNGTLPTYSSTLNVAPAAGNPDGQIQYGTSNFVQFPGMDEDYDACDLENWFLALQSADGQVIIPSFHRPGILMYDKTTTPVTDDWTSPDAVSQSKILRPRLVDHPQFGLPDPRPDSTTGKITYDVDNDGDGNTDSVWLDLGYSPRRNASGKLYKPLFAFMVIGLNGRLPLNTAGNLSLRSSSGSPLYQQATHLGNSPSEIDPTWALQNANGNSNYFYDQVDNAGINSGGTFSGGTYTPGDGGTGYNGIPVTQTQLRNLLSGTRLYDGGPRNGDTNFVMGKGMAGAYPIPLPNNIADWGDAVSGSPYVSASSSGVQVFRNTQAVPGRWGDAGLIPTGPTAGITPMPLNSPGSPASLVFQTPVAPGLPSYDVVASNPGLTYRGGTGDDNLNVYDPSGENTSVYDPSSSVFMPVERIRRFVTPIDPSGDGQVLTWDDNSLPRSATGIATPGYLPTTTYNYFTGYNNPFFPLLNDTGPDHFGRISFFKYFRPPGIAQATASYPYGLGIVPYQQAVLPDLTNNLYHGFEGYRNPKLVVRQDPNSGFYYPVNPLVSGMPYDNPSPAPQSNGTTPATYYVPPAQTPTPPAGTYDLNIFNFFATGTGGNEPYAMGNMNEPDEVNLYDPNNRDQIFGPGDLEWLYRAQDTDGASLQSRLAQLAPVSFTNQLDGTRRRRLFSLESWETTNFVWANDNPLGTFTNNSRFPALGLVNASYNNKLYNQLPTVNPVFVDPTSASFLNLPGQNTNTNTLGTSPFASVDPLQITITGTPSYSYTSPSPWTWYVPTPSVAHRDRKINLNFPLPVSNSPTEPVRQKWIRETYQLLKAILPPKAVDTPQELAQLSQFVVNIIDFRDPDCTMTRFVNTDITVASATATTPSVLSFSTPFTGTPPSTIPAGVPLDYQPGWGTSSGYLIQYGMEYPPVAITEVLAFQFQGAGSVNSAPVPDTKRMFVEIVNTLTESNNNYTTGTPPPNACDLNLSGWDFVVMPDNGLGRPDLYTGQVPFQAGTSITSYPVAGTSASPNTATSSTSVTTMTTPAPTSPFPGLSTLVPALNAGTNAGGLGSDRALNYYYVFGGGTGGATGLKATQVTPGTTGTQNYQITTYDKNAPQMEAYLDMTAQLTTPGKYYWVYLRRPPNPFDDHYDPTDPNENRVVVDCFRFYFNSGTGILIKDPKGNTIAQQNTEYLHSLARTQPFRGGHMVAALPLPAVPPYYQAAAYGYTEQATSVKPPSGYGAKTSTGSNLDYFGLNANATASSGTGTGTTASNVITEAIGNTLGKQPGGVDTDNYWEWLVFNDRDFTSVAELMLVPGCPPGLFTKQFIEQAPWNPASPPSTVITDWVYNSTAIPPTSYATTPPAVTTQPDSKTGTPPGPFRNNAPTSFDVTSPANRANPTANPIVYTTPAAVAVPRTYPYLVDNFFYTGTREYAYPTSGSVTYPGPLSAPYIGGPSGAGWFKMFDFFEVPSPAIGATGLVSQGNNFDWFRQDVKPGLLNLNLIIDEEVFLGLMGFDSSDSYQQAVLTSGNTIPAPTSTKFQLNLTPLLTPPASATIAQFPRVVTQLDSLGNPFSASNGQLYPGYSYQIPNNGAFIVTNSLLATNPGAGMSTLKASFVDFLRIRSGGTNYMFGLQNGVPIDRPFHSLSYPDIDYTVMRPAYPPPLVATPTPPWTGGSWPYTGYTQDPGMKNPYLAATSQPIQSPPIMPPPIPTRRLFQVPDAYGSPLPGNANPNSPTANVPQTPTAATYTAPTFPTAPNQGSNASVFGDLNVNTQMMDPSASVFTIASLFNITYDLTAQSTTSLTTQTSPILQATMTPINDTIEGVGPFWLGNHNGLTYNASQYNGIYDGNNTVNGRILPAAPFQQADMRQHPYFRSEWMQRVMNLTTVRTHQFAVWITVGFFEVTQPGNPQLAASLPNQAYDKLGLELGVLEGSNTRFRGFFLIDRTRATGFNTTAPGDFRDLIVYRKTIE